MSTKSQHLQMRVTPEQKAEIRRRAARAGQDLSAYILSRALPPATDRLSEIVGDSTDDRATWVSRLAALNDLLSGLPAGEISRLERPQGLASLAPHQQNYVAAMVEHVAHSKRVPPPAWTSEVEPLEEPRFAAPLLSLRPYLLNASPVAFKRRNLFVDSTVGDRV